MSDARVSYWREHYARAEILARPWLDLSNEAVQAQTFSLALEAAGAVEGRTCLDVGCGWGRLAVLLKHLGAADVTGVDQVSELIDAHRRARPGIRWIEGNAADPAFVGGLPEVDLLFAVEILQYVPFEPILGALWSRVRPGGRLVGVAPNGDCRIVQSTSLRMGGLYRPLSARGIRDSVGALPDVGRWALRGLRFQDDQALVPYEAGRWTQEPPDGPPSNRLLFVAVRRGDAMLGASR